MPIPGSTAPRPSVEAGLEIRSLREYPFCEWKLDFAERDADGRWRLPGELDGRMPLFFSILASKPG